MRFKFYPKIVNIIVTIHQHYSHWIVTLLGQTAGLTGETSFDAE